MTDFETFCAQHDRLTPRELLMALYKLSQSFERVAMVGGDIHARAEVARRELGVGDG